MIFRLLHVFILSTLLCAPLQAGEFPVVVTSIRPLQLIVNEIMAGAGQAQVLIGDNESPHHFQLKPSQLKMVSQSDLMIWVSNNFETALGRVQQNLPAHSQSLQLVKVLPTANLIGENIDIDGHIWLSPQNVILISRLVNEKLSILDAANQILYRTNSEQLIQNITAWQQQAARKLQASKPRYILDHQFLSYFEHSFGLPEAGSLRGNHDHGGSIRHLAGLHAQLEAHPVACLLVSRLPLSRQTRQLSQRHRLKVKVIETLNENNRYPNIIALLDSIVTSLEDCH